MAKNDSPKATPEKDKAPPKKLPASIVNAAPTAADMMQRVMAVAKLVPALEKELMQSKKNGVIALARAFVALHRLKNRIDEELKPFDELFKKFKEVEMPAAFEVEGVTNVPLAEGFRVGLSHRYLASIKPGQRDQAYQWLRENNLADLITTTVNASTLSAAGKTMLEEKNQELPEDLFNRAYIPNTSVTTTN